jgi:hypothetical protein
MATATRNGKATTLTQVREWISTIDAESVTTGDVMQQFGTSRATARDRLLTLAEEGLLDRTGTGGGARYHKASNGNGAWAPGEGEGKPILPADVSFIGKLASDCDQELARIDSEIAALETARAELLAQEDKLREDRKGVERARSILR